MLCLKNLCLKYKKAASNYSRTASNERRSGTTRNRTGDTRIFSPLLYQLSYGTMRFLICGCKGTTILSYSQIYAKTFYCSYILLTILFDFLS